MSVCIIFPMKQPGKTIHLVHGSTGNGTKIQLHDRLKPDHKHFTNQAWVFNGVHFQSYKDRSKCLTLDGGRAINGTKIELQDQVLRGARGFRNQHFRVVGKNIVCRKNPVMCWYPEKGRFNNGTKIVIQNCGKRDSNGFFRIRVFKDSFYRLNLRTQACLICPLKAPGKVVHLANGGIHNGTKIELRDRLRLRSKNFKNQVWLWDGTIFRSGKAPSKCLHLAGGRTGNGTMIQLWNMIKGGHENQEWRLEGKNIVCRKAPSMCWHLRSGHIGNGTKIQLWDKKNHINGVWKIQMLTDVFAKM